MMPDYQVEPGPGGTQTVVPTAAAPVQEPTPTVDTADEVAGLLAVFPWLDKLGPEAQRDIEQWVVEGRSDYEILGLMRQTAWYANRFPAQEEGNWIDEATYLQREDELRGVLLQYGAPGFGYESPYEYVGLMRMGMTASALQNRFELYNQLKTEARSVRDAFYVYANLDVSTDDLFEATVNPDRRQQLIDMYRERTALSTLDFQTYVERLSDVAIKRMVDLAGELADAGIMGQDTFGRLQAMDPTEARALVIQLYARWQDLDLRTQMGAFSMAAENEGNALLPELDDSVLTITAITQAMNYAMIGAAATEAGFLLPSEQRLDELLSAGVTRAKAIQGYSQIARQGREWMSFARRANIAGLTQTEMENELMMGKSTVLGAAIRAEQALGERTGAAGFQMTQAGKLQQPGLGITYR